VNAAQDDAAASPHPEWSAYEEGIDRLEVIEQDCCHFSSPSFNPLLSTAQRKL
jgi:hypothetical protein